MNARYADHQLMSYKPWDHLTRKDLILPSESISAYHNEANNSKDNKDFNNKDNKDDKVVEGEVEVDNKDELEK